MEGNDAPRQYAPGQHNPGQYGEKPNDGMQGAVAVEMHDVHDGQHSGDDLHDEDDMQCGVGGSGVLDMDVMQGGVGGSGVLDNNEMQDEVSSGLLGQDATGEDCRGTMAAQLK